MKKIQLSKSKLKELTICPRLMWYSVYTPKEKVVSAEQQKVFDQGREVEQIARNIYPQGVLQDKINNFEKVEYTKQLLLNSEVIFEAAFAHKNTIVQFDVLKRINPFKYEATEIKSSSKMKDEYLDDALIQFWIANKSNIEISNFDLWFVNKEATDIVGSGYFAKENVTDFVVKNERKFWTMLSKAQEVIELSEPPAPCYSSYCEECPFAQKCNLNKSNTRSVLNLPKFTNKYKAFSEGILTIEDPLFSTKYKYSENNPTVIESLTKNELIIKKEEIRKELENYQMPLNFFDFEAVMGAIPILKNQKPFEQVVIQYSHHIYSGQDKMDHFSFLHESMENPDLSLIDSMLKHLEQNEGSIVSYNQNYEKTRIKELGLKYPEFSSRLAKLNTRFVDLLDVIKEFVYHPEMKGSYSLKVVSPLLLGAYGSYSDSLIKSGSEIAKWYKEMVETANMDRKKEIKEALLRYCCYDTLNLFLLYKYLLDENVNLAQLVEINLSGGSNG